MNTKSKIKTKLNKRKMKTKVRKKNVFWTKTAIKKLKTKLTLKTWKKKKK